MNLSIDFGPAMVEKIVKETGKVLKRSTYKELPRMKENEKSTIESSLFMESLHQRFGTHAAVGNLADLGTEDTLQYDPYEDELQNVETFSILDENQR